MRPIITLRAMFSLAAGSALLVACGDRESEPPPPPQPSEEPRSIFTDGETGDGAASTPLIAPLETTIAFPEGAELTEAARAELATILRSPQIAQGGEIVLRGHSDAGGSDEANMRASQGRAEAIAAFLVDGGVAEDRIEIIAFGEQNPVAPNALPDGTPNEEGRRENRRVEIYVAAPDGPEAPAAAEEPTIAETLAGELEGETNEAEDPPQ